MSVREDGIWFSKLPASGRNVPPYRVTSRTICARSFASSTMYTWPSIFRFAKSDVSDGIYAKGAMSSVA